MDPSAKHILKTLSQTYLGSIRRGILKTMGGGGVSVCVADKIGQFRKELRLKRSCSRASVAGLEESGQGP